MPEDINARCMPMKAKKIIPILLLLVVLGLLLWVRSGWDSPNSGETPDDQTVSDTENSTPEEPLMTSVNIETIGGVVLVGEDIWP